MPQPTTVGLSTERLAGIDRFLSSRYIDAGKLAGAVTLVARRGEIAHLGAVGSADVERGAPMATDTLFRIYSMTKPLTSVAFMMLVEQGLVALDDPVEAYIPAWKDLGVFVAGIPPLCQTRRPDRPMLIVDLLRHTSGLTYGFQNRTNIDAAYRKAGIGEVVTRGTLAGMIDTLSSLPLEFSPGEAWNYSVATDVIGYLIEMISGMPFQDYMAKHILEPLGMNDTGFHVEPEETRRFAACYARAPDGGLTVQDDPTSSAYLRPPTFYSGGGGLVSTAEDYLKFCAMMLNGGAIGGHRYLSRKTIALMTANHLPGGGDLAALSRSMFSEATNAGIGFGLGFAVNLDPAKVLLPGSVGEYYWGGAASTAFWIDPAEDLIVIFMTQLMPSNTYPIRRQLRTLVYSAIDD